MNTVFMSIMGQGLTIKIKLTVNIKRIAVKKQLPIVNPNGGGGRSTNNMEGINI